MKKIINNIKSKKIKVAIIGLGYVGLELLLAIDKKNFRTTGFDKNLEKINLLNKNKSPISTVSNARIKKTNANFLSNRFFNNLKNFDIVIICLPTPLKKNNKPDNSYLKDCLKDIYPYLKRNQLLIIESTVFPGGIEEIFIKKLKKKFQIGKNFYISFSPERVSPAKKIDLKYNEIVKLISGKTNNCLNIANYFYSKIFKKTHPCNSIEIAEFTKVYENAYRAVNISFVNQMKMICKKFDINIYDIIEAAKTKSFGFIPYQPSPGIGGHCIPIDPAFISFVARKKKIKATIIENALKINSEVTKWVVTEVLKRVKANSRILILGIGYKKDVDDYRESASVKILKSLDKKCKVYFYDPYVKKIKIMSHYNYSIKKFSYEKLKNYDAVVLGTDHSIFKYNLILKFSKIIFDTRTRFGNIKSKKVIHC